MVHDPPEDTVLTQKCPHQFCSIFITCTVTGEIKVKLVWPEGLCTLLLTQAPALQCPVARNCGQWKLWGSTCPWRQRTKHIPAPLPRENELQTLNDGHLYKRDSVAAFHSGRDIQELESKAMLYGYTPSHFIRETRLY
ncbi:hypothetical protein UY3_13155 [Chelonia mydas]|uniref:Uncharacterized protein n=1 Tax=Chelonia mydas TaxID=8469 RepID=M7B2U0_CHEMY|nr:hypothetical protein UY3_13155 [Chelonia mydas]